VEETRPTSKYDSEIDIVYLKWFIIRFGFGLLIKYTAKRRMLNVIISFSYTNRNYSLNQISFFYESMKGSSKAVAIKDGLESTVSHLLIAITYNMKDTLLLPTITYYFSLTYIIHSSYSLWK
jgi:hypothetical protein